MVRNKVKALLKMSNKNNKSGAAALNMSYASFTNKLNKHSFKTEDLIKLANLTDTTLAFIDKDGRVVVTFNSDDIETENAVKPA